MESKTALKKLSKEELLSGLDRSKRKSVRLIFDNTEVHYLVLMESPDGHRRNLVTVGPNLELPNLEALDSLSFDGLVPVAYVSLETARTRRATKLFRTRGAETIQQLETEAGSLRLENQRLRSQLDALLKMSGAIEQERLESGQRAEELARQHREQNEFRLQLAEREEELLKMEEQLMDRMHAMVQKEAELQQWEENMFARERKLLELQEKLDHRKDDLHASCR
ncbi:hypothetical protein [Coraliomargarita parva]|uniref:hypothetical protein n=1 Tax=Coraliomargarita parva TaxID=3014050 RepID=UPI0022B39925|nr:hypothetical protein [Coraliomargarita parva]